MKKGFILLIGVILLSGAVFAQSYKIEISQLKDTFEAGESIVVKLSLLDESNNPVNTNILVFLENTEKSIILNRTVQTNQFVNIPLGKDAPAGEWKISVEYQEAKATGFFVIKQNAEISFAIQEDVLTIQNIGNTKNTEKIRIKIGDTLGEERALDLNVGESVNYRLIAPESQYEIKVIGSNGQVLFSQSNVALKGRGLTGEVVGAVDESQSRSGITGGLGPDENSNDSIASYLRGSKFPYIFIFVVFGAAVLLAVQRNYRRKAGE